MTEKPCLRCGAPVPPKVGGGGRPKVYCSLECRWAAGNARKPQPRNVPRAASRGPLPVFANKVGWSLRADVERLERIFADDRFDRNKEQVAAHLHSHLAYAAEVCQDLLSRIDHPIGE